MKKAIILSMNGSVAQWRDYGDDPEAFPPADTGTQEIDLPDDFVFPNEPRWFIDGKLTEEAPHDRRALYHVPTGNVIQWRDYVLYTYPELDADTQEIPLDKGFQIPEGDCWFRNGEFTQVPPPPPKPLPPTEQQVKEERNARLVAANLRKGALQDAVEIGEATAEEEALLGKWKAYTTALTRIPSQPGFPADVQWPEAPEEL
ncbi:tail fiber assembly protein [Edwardsiella phage vB_EpM_ZHS]|jgi:hypothetical protein|nr:tail fiber assembly protein [Edwardsiella phage vB_EpM_ZHS]